MSTIEVLVESFKFNRSRVLTLLDEIADLVFTYRQNG